MVSSREIFLEKFKKQSMIFQKKLAMSLRTLLEEFLTLTQPQE